MTGPFAYSSPPGRRVTAATAAVESSPQPAAPRLGLRAAGLVAGIGLAFFAVSFQLIRLAMIGQNTIKASVSEVQAETHARPDIVDRNGRLLATDVEVPSLYADPSRVVGRDELAERLEAVFPDLDALALRAALGDTSRRFVWVRRGLSPRLAQRVHDLGLPGLAFRNELKRVYPAVDLAGHVLGSADVDNRGAAGIERWIDTAVGIEAVHWARPSERAPVRLSLDLGVQHTLEDELATAERRHHAVGTAGLVMDIDTGEILASASRPAAGPERAGATADKVSGGVFELGSIMKLATVGMALDLGIATPETIIDVTQPLTAGRFTISDSHAAGRPLTVAEIFTQSSNVGVAYLALDAGPLRHRAFLERIGLVGALATELGPVAAPLAPKSFDRATQITAAYGHGLAVSPLQFAAAAAALLNGGLKVAPTFVKRDPGTHEVRERVLKPETSKALAALMRANVTDPSGTGRRAAVPGLDVGGKTGTAEIAGPGGYREKSVIASFLAAFPMSKPRYLVLVSVFEPKGISETDGQITAGTVAAPLAGRVIARIAPQLGIAAAGPLAAAGP